MKTNPRILVFLCFVVAQILKTNGLFRMSKVNCEATDPTYVKFHYCRLRPVNRYKSEFSFKMSILRPSFEKVSVHIEHLKKYSTQIYRVTYMNTTLNLCAYLKNPSKYPLPSIIFNLFLPYTNINHTCPYLGDIYMTKFYLAHDLITLPLSAGEYLIKTEWIVDKAYRFKVYVYFVFEEPSFSENRTRKH